MQTTVDTAATEPQWQTALDKANAVRLARADIKRDLKEGRRQFADLLADPPDVIRGLPLFEVLRWVPGIDRVRAKKILYGLIFSDTLKIDSVGDVTRRKVLDRMAHHQPDTYRFRRAA